MKPIAGFECSLDEEPFSTCANTNPATINLDNLAAGKHTFSVRAVDTQGNKDPNPDTFRNWLCWLWRSSIDDRRYSNYRKVSQIKKDLTCQKAL